MLLKMLKNHLKNITSDCINICLYHFGIVMIIVVQFNSRVVDNIGSIICIENLNYS